MCSRSNTREDEFNAHRQKFKEHLPELGFKPNAQVGLDQIGYVAQMRLSGNHSSVQQVARHWKKDLAVQVVSQNPIESLLAHCLVQSIWSSGK